MLSKIKMILLFVSEKRKNKYLEVNEFGRHWRRAVGRRRMQIYVAEFPPTDAANLLVYGTTPLLRASQTTRGRPHITRLDYHAFVTNLLQITVVFVRIRTP